MLERSGCVLKEIAPLLSTVKAEDLPLVAPPTLLGVLLPERGSLGFGEKRLTNWLVGGNMKS
jgi:hypothetical protein